LITISKSSGSLLAFEEIIGEDGFFPDGMFCELELLVLIVLNTYMSMRIFAKPVKEKLKCAKFN
jgi:hypothetical protein